MSIKVRPRLASDLPACTEALYQVHLTDHYPAIWSASPENWLSSDKERMAWVAVDTDDRICGHIALHKVDGHDASNMWAEATKLPSEALANIVRLFVSTDARRKGVGEALMAEATKYARSLGLFPVLNVGQYNKEAAQLYDKLGWQLVGQLDNRQIPIFLYVAPLEEISKDSLDKEIRAHIQ